MPERKEYSQDAGSTEIQKKENVPASLKRKFEKYILRCLKRRMTGTFTINRPLNIREIIHLPPGTILTMEKGQTIVEILDNKKRCDVLRIASFKVPGNN